MNDNNTPTPEQTTRSFACPSCGGTNVITTTQTQEFTYGVGADAVRLSAEIPVRRCGDCRFEFYDREGEEARHEAVCRYLRVMTPHQIRDLRLLHECSQADFAELTQLGEATISRWERGALIQTHAYDNYLYLLGFEDNIRRLRQRSQRAGPLLPRYTYRAIQITAEVQNRMTRFSLVGCMTEE